MRGMIRGDQMMPGRQGAGGPGVVKSGGGTFTQDRIPFGASDGKLTESAALEWITNLIRVGGAGGVKIGADSVQRDGFGALRLGANGVTAWQIDPNSFAFQPEADNTRNLGSTSTAVKALIQGAAGRRQQAIADGTAQSGAGATVTIATSPTLDDNANTLVMAYVSGGKSDESEGAGYFLIADYRRTGGGAPTICGAVTALFTGETDATANATLAVSGNTIIVQGTSPAGDTYDWYASIDLVRRT